MALVSKTFRIFVSSTFSDLKDKRNTLQFATEFIWEITKGQLQNF